MKLSDQQNYYSHLVKNLPEPFKSFSWAFSGFNGWINNLVFEAGLEEEGLTTGKIRPDGWFADEKSRTLYLLEIVETHDITNNKAYEISELFWVLDEAEWFTKVVLFYPRFGQTSINDSCQHIGSTADLKFPDDPSAYRKAFTLGIRGVPADSSYAL